MPSRVTILIAIIFLMSVLWILALLVLLFRFALRQIGSSSASNTPTTIRPTGITNA